MLHNALELGNQLTAIATLHSMNSHQILNSLSEVICGLLLLFSDGHASKAYVIAFMPRPGVQFLFLSWPCCDPRQWLCVCAGLANTTQITRSSKFVSRDCFLMHYFDYKILLCLSVCSRVPQLTYPYVLAFLQSSKNLHIFFFFSSCFITCDSSFPLFCSDKSSTRFHFSAIIQCQLAHKTRRIVIKMFTLHK